MKRFTRWLTALGLTVALLGCGAAMAAGESVIHVQLNGQEMAFTDAAPQVKDQRTFLPFRAVFEAMGAQVSSEGSVITAVKDGKTLTMTLNETAASLTEGDKTTPITMDVAPYVDNTTWRTYVPVRFAAQAFGCAVGWDQQSSTAIIIDAGQLVDETIEGKKFTYLEKFAAYSQRYNEGIWDFKGGFDAEMTMMAMPITMNGTIEGAIQDSEKMNMGMNMKMDLAEFMESISLLTQMGGGEPAAISAEDQAMLDALKKDGIDLDLRADMAEGAFYVNMAGELLEAAGLSGKDWYKLDMADLLEQAGMDWAELIDASKAVDYNALVKQALSSLELTDSAGAYDEVKTTVEKIASALSDEGFVKKDSDYTATLDLSEEGVNMKVALTLTMKNGEVTAYSMDMTMTAVEGETEMVMTVTAAVDEKDRMTMTMRMDMASLLTLEMNMDCAYTQGKTAPVTEPPAGANVVDYMELLNAQMGADVGVIGGADGPTSIIVGE